MHGQRMVNNRGQEVIAQNCPGPLGFNRNGEIPLVCVLSDATPRLGVRQPPSHVLGDAAAPKRPRASQGRERD